MLLAPNDRELFRRIWKLTWPLVIYNLLEMTVGLVDLVMVRPFGSEATAAIGVCRQVTFFVEAAAVAISTGLITLVSQHVGARRVDQVDALVRQSVVMVALLGLPMTLVGFLLSGPLLVAMNASPATLAYGHPYLKVYFLGIIVLWGNVAGAALFRGAGDPWTPLRIALVVNALNVALNYAFIYGAGPIPAMEVQGAALGTVVARSCGLLVLLGILLRGSNLLRLRRSYSSDETASGRRFDWTLFARILRIGAPMALAGVFRNGSRLVFLAILGAAGALGMSFQAAVGVGLQVRLIGVLPALAFQVATATLVGQAIGRGDYREAESLGRRSIQLLAMLMFVVTASIILMAAPLATLFIKSPEIAALGTKVLRWFAVAQFFSALSIAAQGALMGAGDTGPSLRFTIISQWIIMLPLVCVAIAAGWVPRGPLAAWAIAPFISFLLTYRRFRNGRWKLLKVAGNY